MRGLALITGGAGAIAGALGERLLARGHDLLLVDRDAPGLDHAARRAPGRIATMVADLTVPDDLERVAAVVAETPDLALLVNNAGVVRPGDFADIAYADAALQLAVNLIAPARLTHAAAARFRAERQGAILSVISAAGLVSLPGSAAYSASKFGLRGLLIALAQELEPHGVRVRSVLPGAVDTPMLRYEATHGGSVLNFVNKDVLGVDQVAEAAMRALDGRRIEISVPAGDALLTRIVCAFPALMPRVLPWFEKKGRAGLQRYCASRGLTLPRDQGGADHG